MSKAPQDISPETDAYCLHLSGFGVSDIAVRRFGRDDDETRAKVRDLIAAGRAKAASAH